MNSLLLPRSVDSPHKSKSFNSAWGYFTQVILCNKSKGRELVSRESLRISKVSCIEHVVLVRLVFMISPIIFYIKVAYIDKEHHTGTNQVFNGCIPNSM